MKTALITISYCIFGQLLVHTPCLARDWTSPDGSVTVRIQPADAASGSHYQVIVGETPARFISESRIRRENHGYDWMNSASSNWLDNRFITFEDDSGLGIVDAQQHTILLDQVFEAYTYSPQSKMWAAIRYRPTSRNQDQLEGGEKDTIWFIEPNELAANADLSTSEHPFAHVATLQLNGIAVARPYWSEDGTVVAIAKHLNGKPVADVFDPKLRKLVRSVSLPELTLTRDQMLSAWIIPEVDQKAFNAIKANHVFEAAGNETAGISSVALGKDSRANTPNFPAKNDSDARSSPSTSKDKQSQWILWSTVALSTIAVLGLLSFFGKKQK